MQFDCTNLAEEWDQSEDVRSRLRKKGALVANILKSRDSTIAQCVANVPVLVPLLHRLSCCRLKLPEIDGLREQCAKAYALASRTPSEDTVDDDGWELRKMLRLVKRKAKREEVSMESRLSSKPNLLNISILKTHDCTKPRIVISMSSFSLLHLIFRLGPFS